MCGPRRQERSRAMHASSASAARESGGRDVRSPSSSACTPRAPRRRAPAPGRGGHGVRSTSRAAGAQLRRRSSTTASIASSGRSSPPDARGCGDAAVPRRTGLAGCRVGGGASVDRAVGDRRTPGVSRVERGCRRLTSPATATRCSPARHLGRAWSHAPAAFFRRAAAGSSPRGGRRRPGSAWPRASGCPSGRSDDDEDHEVGSAYFRPSRS